MAREPELAVTCDALRFISAEFVARPGMDALDLVAALGAFLVAKTVTRRGLAAHPACRMIPTMRRGIGALGTEEGCCPAG